MTELETGLARFKTIAGTVGARLNPLLDKGLARVTPWVNQGIDRLGKVEKIKTAAESVSARVKTFVGEPADANKVGVVLGGVVVVVMILGGIVTRANVEGWYNGLEHPFFTPPNAAFGPLWAIMFTLMGVAAWRVWKVKGWTGSRDALTLWGISLFFNLMWSVLFFAFGWMGLAFIWDLLFLAVTAMVARSFFLIEEKAGWLMTPVAIWVGFAALLNLGMLAVN
ncbi:TspO/MBR family protein [Pararhodospirillum oryzae]|uniref:Tryptophan-rich sensory protein n=1 Tax=Pararhodospirillum oryzae TaxID=478448 RepID=A0A512H952_9PROT|nr:TspO/MBR family protein [Pararhodospirillum oryzae]GEO81983.1 hypothetical protein ROR02_21140 [Pararhodospirillum oryzae]